MGLFVSSFLVGFFSYFVMRVGMLVVRVQQEAQYYGM